jgi:hypothetical protein
MILHSDRRTQEYDPGFAGIRERNKNKDKSMFEQMENVPGNIVALKMNGEITEKDLENISSILDEAIKKYGTISLLLIVEHYETYFSSASLYEDLKFAHLYSENIERMAVVGDRAWKSTWVALFGLFSGFSAQYFDKSEIE